MTQQPHHKMAWIKWRINLDDLTNKPPKREFPNIWWLWLLTIVVILLIFSLMISASLTGYSAFHDGSIKRSIDCLYLHPYLGLSHCPELEKKPILLNRRRDQQ